MQVVAVVLAGGSGHRFGGDLPKQLRVLAGRTVIEHSIAAFDQAPGVDSIMVVMPPGLAAAAGDLLAAGDYRKVARVIEGGVARTDSTQCAIEALLEAGQAGADADCSVLFHDAARPLIDQRIIADCVDALSTHQAIGVAVPSSDTIVEVTDGVVTAMPRRDALARFQTPQGFRLSLIRHAYQLAAADPGFGELPATDDCGIVHRYLPDVPVRLVPGSERNIKITYPDDLHVAETLLRLAEPGTARRQ
jgi:ribitol-5-phosphate 2-dehydrogenase (NADP+) / D-ribitol-5-phosphate cytidylyltransferase